MNEAVTHYCMNESCSMHRVEQARWWNHRHPTTGQWGSWWVTSGKCSECGRVMTPADVEVERDDMREYRLAAAKVRREAIQRTSDLLEQGRIFDAWRQEWLEAHR